ncbi:MAG: ATP-binding protein [Candidatus Komeilibacteria bacterium]|nr:ATP-binding protein [Candidatus Komeilibacteria bacterium]
MSKNPQKYLQALGIHSLQQALVAYNPWWKTKSFSVLGVPDFKRDAFIQAMRHTEANHGLALLINGPRRVGKTTIINQVIRCLIEEKKVPVNRILFFSLDDPLIQQLPQKDQGTLFEALLAQWAQVAGTALRTSPNTLYCFLDEIQRLPRWELYIKRYIDLRYPIRFIISGSASHTIFRKSLESLLGRLVDISLPPFTFREYVRYHHPEHGVFLNKLAEDVLDIGEASSVIQFNRRLSEEIKPSAIQQWNRYADEYAQRGGFPQLWMMGTAVERSVFIDQQFVERVTLEDLRLVKEIRRPEIFHQFLRYAFARTSQEYNLEELAGLIHTTRVTLTEALPLLLQTELIRKVERFTGKPVRLRSTHAKLYAADLMLMQGITKIITSLEGEERGRIAETLAHNVIRLFPGVSDISYYREPSGQQEVDFVARVGSRVVPIEIVYKNQIDSHHRDSVRSFLETHGKQNSFGILVTKEDWKIEQPILEIPLSIFMLTA